MYKIKEVPEHFIVKELIDLNLKQEGKFLCLKVTKTKRNTLDVVKEMSKQLRLKNREIGFCGTKDKIAITEQYMTIPPKDLSYLNIDNVIIEKVGYLDEQLSLGSHQGNHFEIIVETDQEIIKRNFFPNYFGEQRFSTKNVQIGKALVKKDFKTVCELLELEPQKNDYVGAIKKIPIRMLKLYVNSYQSYLWNKEVYSILKSLPGFEKDYSQGKFYFPDNFENFTVPLIGYFTDNVNEQLLKEEGIKKEDFLIRQIPEISAEGDQREVKVEVKNLKIIENKICFDLPKGSYATVFVDSLFK
jgi:tRNA pseudouridine13 synthase